ncbi:MAG: hypothetical protein ACREHG_09155, partial [Candidatus Saccharimonadales bacterium]
MYEYHHGEPSETLDKAKKLFGEGVDPAEIERRTGWLMGLDRLWKSWIPHSEEATLKMSPLEMNANSLGGIKEADEVWRSFEKGEKTPLTEKLLSLDDVLDFPDFVKNHPDVDKNTKIAFFSERGPYAGAAYYSSEPSNPRKVLAINVAHRGGEVPGGMEAPIGTMAFRRQTILHELQHVLQPFGGRSPFEGDPDANFTLLKEIRPPVVREIAPGEYIPVPINYDDSYAVWKLANQLYSDFSDEIEARASGDRMRLGDFIAKEGKDKYYWDPAEYQELNLIVFRPRELPRFLSDSKGTIYGFVHDGKMYLNGDKLNSNTPLHEASHLFTSWLKRAYPDLHREGLDQMDGTDYLKKVKTTKFYQDQAEALRKNGASDAD